MSNAASLQEWQPGDLLSVRGGVDLYMNPIPYFYFNEVKREDINPMFVWDMGLNFCALVPGTVVIFVEYIHKIVYRGSTETLLHPNCVCLYGDKYLCFPQEALVNKLERLSLV